MTHSHRKGFLEFPCGVERLPNGNTLIVDAGDESNTGSELLEVDPKGQIVWRHSDDLNFAHSVSLQKNGNYLITDTTNNRIVEIDRENRIAFTSDDWGDETGKLSDGSHLSYPNDAHETPDGDFLVTDRNGNRCIIVSKEGVVRWEYSYGIKHPHNADLLPNGNVIIADSDQNRVIEVDRDHQVVWSYGDQPGHEALNWPRDADRLPNGNTLICDSKNSRVLEVTTDGRLVWSYGLPYFANPYEADRLSNGNTLISDQQRQRVFEVDSYGNVVWQFRNNVPSYSIYPKLHNGFFKQREESGLPEGWTLLTRMSEGGGELLWKQDERGKDFVGLEYRRHGALFLVQRVGVVPGRSYRLGGQIRADSISEGAFAAFQVAFRDNFGGLTQDAMAAPKGQMLVGTTDWIHDTVETVAPDSATSAEIRVMITGPGCTWVRGLMFMQSN